MLDIPSTGFPRSVKVHNVELDCMCDWIEGCITFCDDTISVSDIVDSLCENNVYDEQDFAKQHVDNAFRELTRRASCLDNAGSYEVQHLRLRRRKRWDEVPAYSFCLMLSLRVLYRSRFRQFGNYTDQGLLFERLTAESLGRLGWVAHSTAWSRQATDGFRKRVEDLATHLGEACLAHQLDKWADEHAKDGGLDIVCHLPFPDRWSGRPLLYVQCASGEDWKDKRATPNLSLWQKLLDTATHPRRGIAIPFALLNDDFRRAANYDDLSLLLDRHRLCAPQSGIEEDWLSPGLAADLNAWTGARITDLSLADAGTS
jgi:hypothetical protein